MEWESPEQGAASQHTKLPDIDTEIVDSNPFLWNFPFHFFIKMWYKRYERIVQIGWAKRKKGDPNEAGKPFKHIMAHFSISIGTSR